MRPLAAALFLVLMLLAGCARPVPRTPSYSQIFAHEVAPEQAIAALRPPTGACLQNAQHHLSGRARLLSAPLDAAVRSRLELVLRRLHPRARQVLAHTQGVWPVENLSGASALFVPCPLKKQPRTGGFILVDINAFPLDRPLRDAEVPGLFWATLAGPNAPAPLGPHPALRSEHANPTPTDHAIRYLLLHELGHALSMYTGEFDIDARHRFRIVRMDRFAGYSWRFVDTQPNADRGVDQLPLVRAVIPRVALDTFQWGSVLSVLDEDAALDAPGYVLSRANTALARTLYLCAAAANLPAAGFVTPSAARYPTEDYAEMFAHAILADEGKIHPTDQVPVDLPLCQIKSLPAPYFSAAVGPKRRYLERALGLRPRAF